MWHDNWLTLAILSLCMLASSYESEKKMASVRKVMVSNLGVENRYLKCCRVFSQSLHASTGMVLRIRPRLFSYNLNQCKSR
jgi:hypothetical protein